MTIPAAAANAIETNERRDPTRIGGARPSHLIYTAGVGATVDLPAMSVVVRGLDAWNPEHQDTVVEPRLLDMVRRALGNQVRSLKHAPWDPKTQDEPYTRVGVPVSPFPGWLRCPSCFRLGPIDNSQFVLIHNYGRRPDLAKYVHAQCAKQGNKSLAKRKACIPARFVVVCDDGHLDDFPYREYVHATRTGGICNGPLLTMSDAASTVVPMVTLTCVNCKSDRHPEKNQSRTIQDAIGRDGWENLPNCRGRHPHLQQFEQNGCGKRLRLMVLGASNLWFPVSASALHLPTEQTVTDLVIANWELLEEAPSLRFTQRIIEGMDELRALRAYPIEDVWACIERLLAEGGPKPPEAPESLRDEEWRLLSRPTTERQDPDFRAVATESPDGYDRLLDQVVLVSRLREVRALVGFTRINSPDREDLQPAKRVRLARRDPDWVPAVEQRGEGIFLQLREDQVAPWVARVDDHQHIRLLRESYRQWRFDRAMPPEEGFPIARSLLIHTLSHLLMRQMALECGYSSASLRERLYLGTRSTPAAGVLISTAASDSEGTLGGLVSLGTKVHLQRLLGLALEEAEHCSSDPLCSEHLPTPEHAVLHAAACHACLFASETSCETGNRWLDRAVLINLTNDGLAFEP
jgi:hypothetical protein